MFALSQQTRLSICLYYEIRSSLSVAKKVVEVLNWMLVDGNLLCIGHPLPPHAWQKP